jgi:hypothetical protein
MSTELRVPDLSRNLVKLERINGELCLWGQKCQSRVDTVN